MVTQKVILLVGPTGHGKSSIIYDYAIEEKPEIGHAIESETVETKSYDCDIAGEQVVMFDTPGLGDTQQRDQRFLSELVTVLQDNCGGIHKIFFVLQVHETRFNAFLAVCLSLLLELAPDIHEKPTVLTIVLAKANAGSDMQASQEVADRIQQLRAKINTDFGVDFEVILAGRGNMQQFEQSVQNASLSTFCQTQFMVKVKTMDTKMKQAYEDLENARKQNEASQQHIGQLMTAVEQANSAYRAAEQRNEQDAQVIAQLHNAVNTANKNAEDAKTKYESDQQKFTELQNLLVQAKKETDAAKADLKREVIALKDSLSRPIVVRRRGGICTIS